jgi:hypothetical protein
MHLRTFFLQYLLVFSIGTILLLGLLLGLFTAAFTFNVVLPANYAEKEIEAVKDQLAAGVSFPSGPTLKLADYAVFTPGGERLLGNLNDRETSRAWEMIQQEKVRSPDSYTTVGGGDKIWILRYFYTTIQSGEDIWIFRYIIQPGCAAIFPIRSCWVFFSLSLVFYCWPPYWPLVSDASWRRRWPVSRRLQRISGARTWSLPCSLAAFSR